MIRRFAVPAVAALALLLPALPVSASTTHGWIQNAYTEKVLSGSFPSTASYFFNRLGSFGTGNGPGNPIVDGYATRPVLRYESEAQFASDVASGVIPSSTWPAGSYVELDIEDWAGTPQKEIDDPFTYMTGFAKLAHSIGDKVILTPARDLGNDPGSVCPKQSGWNLDAWYENCQVAKYAAAGDIIAVQDQADTTTPSAYRALFNAARSQALAARPGVKVYTEVSDNYGTAAQAYTAATGVTFDGVFLNVANSDVSWENSLLNKFKSGGY